MAGKKNPLADKAYEMYKNGEKLVDIAAALNVPSGTVRRWKSTHKWDSERSVTKSERSHKKEVDNIVLVEDGTKETLENNDLTAEQQMFCIYYSRTFNAAQSYQKAYGCSYESAIANGSRLITFDKVKNEINRLKEIKRQQIIAEESDFVEMQMRIAFSDIGNYLSFGREKVKVIGAYGPIKNPETGEYLTQEVNSVRLSESKNVDTQIIQEVKQGKDGVSVKLADKQKAIDWLDRYFEMNPDNKHRKEYDKRKLEMELLKLEMQTKESADDTPEQDNFLDALNQSAKEVWSND